MKKVLLDIKFWHICVQSINSLWFTLNCETVINYCVIIMLKMASWSNDKSFQIFLSTSTSKCACNSSKILLHFVSVTTSFLHLLSLMFLNSFLMLFPRTENLQLFHFGLCPHSYTWELIWAAATRLSPSADTFRKFSCV